jgi:dTDP-4-dehydrorhamnose 3,5-epimerase
MKRFQIVDTSIPSLKVIVRQRINDSRGFLSRLFCADEFNLIGFSKKICQINHTETIRKGTLRGMHFQNPPHLENKVISCIHGEVWDVAVDLREGSPTFLNWHAEYLSATNMKALFVPKGFAHGFQSVTDNAELIYAHSESYASASEAAIHPLDPLVGITWPEPITEISIRDQNHKFISQSFKGIKI